MSSAARDPSIGWTVAVAMASLAAAMGVGRFAATPMLPLMQEAFGLTLTEGAWLATANYVGYFVGAAATFLINPRAGMATRGGLLTVAASTLAMGFTSAFAAWLAWRFVSGIGSAFVLVGASSWALAHLAASGKPQASGGVFSGVGVGVCVAGVVALVAGVARVHPARAWLILGAICVVVVLLAWRPLSVTAAAVQGQEAHAAVALTHAEWILVACYGAFGFGYVIPATFIPAAARTLVNDPWVFGWAWPVFGLAAAASTIVVATFLRATPPRRVAAASLAVMAVGVIAPIVVPSVPSLVVSALCVGGTFMVATMAAAQEARRIAVGSPTKLIAALTAAFAIGQVAGPLLIGVSGGSSAAAGALAFTLLLLSAAVLWRTDAPARPVALTS